MHLTRTAVSLNVPDVEASAGFARHFGFTPAMAADGFVSLEHPDTSMNVIFLATGLPTFKPQEIAGSAGQGLLLVLVVEDLDAQFERVAAEGARVLTPPETEEWGERYCQFADPNGVVWQLVQWMT
jgi:catechol 2,3-dioxygenase-like lactoylglutathione lyase family enzyme